MEKDYALKFYSYDLHSSCSLCNGKEAPKDSPVIIYISHEGTELSGEKIFKRIKEENIKEGNIKEGNIKEEGIKESDIKEKLQGLYLCEILVHDWDSMLTPWRVENCLKDRSFSGQAPKLLHQIETEVLPIINEKWSEHGEVIMAGYSLGGLFSLWSLYESSLLDGAVCCSGSLWYPGFEEYMTRMSFDRNVSIYLSLGKKEAGGKNPVLSKVGDITTLQYELLLQNEKVDYVIFQWNEGGHFSDPEGRIVKGIQCILNRKRL